MEQSLGLARTLSEELKAIDLSSKLSTNTTKTGLNSNNNNDDVLLFHTNRVPFNCPICLQRFEIDEGVILASCLHEFCRKCMVAKIQQNRQFIRVHCPFDNGYKCESFLTEDEVVGLVSENIEFIKNNQVPVATKIMEVDDEIIVIGDSDDEPVKSSNSNYEDARTQSQKSKFNCPRCLRLFVGENGVILEICKHSVCKECIIDHYFKNRKIPMKCEFKTDVKTVCGNNIDENEIRSVLNEIGLNELDETINLNSSSQQEVMAAPLVRNKISFCCGICYLECPIGRGVKLKQCSHHVCEPCLRETIRLNYDPEISCPYSKSYERCASFLTHPEIKSLTSMEEYRKFKQIAIKKATEPCEFYLLTMMDELSYVKNTDEFDCPICFVQCSVGDGIKLRDCLHQFCLECFTSTVTHSEDESIKCPFTDDTLSHCEIFIQEREIRAVVSNELFNKFLERKIKYAEHTITNSFHCKTVDCVGFGIIEPGDVVMICSICRQHNCLNCKAIHEGQSCEDYQDSLTGSFKVTERYINTLKDLGDVMNCPKCDALINKIAGCSWLQCTFCKTEICWATRGPRWGPKGNGDISGGCKCRVNGKLCHPQCGNCH